MNNFVVIQLDTLRLGLQASAVEQVIHAVAITPLPKAPDITLGVINVRGNLVPVVDLRRRLGLPTRDLALSDKIVLTRTSKRPLAVVADAVQGLATYTEADITKTAQLVSGVDQIVSMVGSTDGIVFIHDLERFLSADEGVTLDAAVAAKGLDMEAGDAP